ncbi:MAG: hypothetical protein JW984_02000 [Deltaproteobacteria bacterium]|uniref:Alpha/beta hydrolase n=1 Tax=Candidatus Zymogenus saltonus TaxID=2844893 RepID=A0A9D8KCW9_9DELT|nr:hypothetical protein [Candidatus Zymogenus saltonus]
MTKKRKNPYSYLNLLMDVLRERSFEKGVRVHDLKLQAMRERPVPKRGSWGKNGDGSEMTRRDYDRRLESFRARLPELLFPGADTEFTVEDESGKSSSIEELIDSRTNGLLTFRSNIETSFTRNNTVRAHIYPERAKKGKAGLEKAIIILPNLRAEERAFATLGRLLNRFGYTALEMVHPYHGERHDPKDTEMVPGERLFSADMLDTLYSFSQGISDILGGLLYLIKSGFKRIGVIGASIGSTFTIMSTAYALEYREFLFKKNPELVKDLPESIFRAAIINLSGGFLRDFIMDPDNIEAEYVRTGLVEDLKITGMDVEKLWPVVDPMKFVNKINIPILAVKARQDPVLLYRYSSRQREFFAKNEVGGKNFREIYMPFPAGHYSATYLLPKMTIGVSNLLFILKHV